jgi:methylase of polypeptide subunit release factors
MFLMIKEWYLPNIDDVFFFGTSLTMDTVMSNMPYVVNRMYDEMYPSMKQYDNPFYKAGPGVNMYRWIVQQNIIVHRVLRSFQIYRIHDIPLDPVIDYHQIMRNQRTKKLH